jgi:hypothetical protein
MRHLVALLLASGIARAEPLPLYVEASEVREAKAMTAVGTSLLCTDVVLAALVIGFVGDGLWVQRPAGNDAGALGDGMFAFGFGLAAVLPLVVGTALVASGVHRLGRLQTIQATPGGLAVRF